MLHHLAQQTIENAEIADPILSVNFTPVTVKCFPSVFDHKNKRFFVCTNNPANPLMMKIGELNS